MLSEEMPGYIKTVWQDHTDQPIIFCSSALLFCVCSTDDSYSHYSLSVHGCRLSLFYWPDVSAARPVKFLWKLEQVLGELPHL